MQIEDAAKKIKDFEQHSLTTRLSDLEARCQGLARKEITDLCATQRFDSSLLEASYAVKNLAGQINVIIHAVGILMALPKLLETTEKIEYLSLGAGNTGRKFDLETNIRVAEFKFIQWRGGAESIRQNSLFKDFYELAEAATDKKKFLYVLGLTQPLKFLRGRRSLKSVLSKNAALASSFRARYNDSISVVCEYYEMKGNEVEIIDITPIVPDLSGEAT